MKRKRGVLVDWNDKIRGDEAFDRPRIMMARIEAIEPIDGGGGSVEKVEERTKSRVTNGRAYICRGWARV